MGVAVKIERAEIERLLSLAEDRPHNHYAMYGEEIIAVCRAWLALDAAPVAEVEYDGGADAFLYFCGAPEELSGCRWNAIMGEKLHGQVVRLVASGDQQ